ncbi:serine/threonine-protein kinase [Nonomuraea sp. NPDC049725]|uniref:serine/threonine-protein kinase n=1 Tax=Nonomuraea sp. NPDC049725 TaxID=3154508 RepID=UPI00344219CD
MVSAPRPLSQSDPARVGAYQVEALLGEGGQGAVYLGRDPSGRPVAIKVLHARLVAEHRRQFVRELDAARSVGSFGTARVLEADVDGDRPYIVSEYIPGESLQQLISRDGPRDAGGLRRLMLATAAALQAIHQAGIVHRDFKPGNVLLGPDGPRVVDFGIARVLEATATQTSSVVGTPPYMSPEQLGGEPVGPESDVFSWAVSMVFAATGRPAFGQDSIPAVFNRILTQPPDLTGVPQDVRDVLADCLAKSPADRPTAGELLRRILGQDEEAAPARRAGRPVTWAFVMQMAAVVVTLVVALAADYGYEPDPGGGFSPAPFPWVASGVPFWPIMFVWIAGGVAAVLFLRRRG